MFQHCVWGIGESFNIGIFDDQCIKPLYNQNYCHENDKNEALVKKLQKTNERCSEEKELAFANFVDKCNR